MNLAGNKARAHYRESGGSACVCVCMGGVVFALRVKSVLKSKVVAFIG